MMGPWDGLCSMISRASQGSGVATLADIDAMFESMFRNARTEPDLLYVSVEDWWLFRRARIYAVNPLPRRHLRKCFVRKRRATIKQGLRRLRRLQQAKEKAMVCPDLYARMEPLSSRHVTMRVERKGRGKPLSFDEIKECFGEYDEVLQGLAKYDKE